MATLPMNLILMSHVALQMTRPPIPLVANQAPQLQPLISPTFLRKSIFPMLKWSKTGYKMFARLASELNNSHPSVS